MITSLRICLSAAAIAAAATFAIAEEQTAAPASAPGTATAATAGGDQPKPGDPDETICKRQKVTGTRVGNYHICLTRKEWDEMAHTSSEDTSRFQRQRDATRTGPPGASN